MSSDLSQDVPRGPREKFESLGLGPRIFLLVQYLRGTKG